MPPPPVPRVLVPRARRTHGLPPHGRRAEPTAVPLPPVAARAEEEDLPARRPRTHHAPQRLHAPLPPAAGGVDDVTDSCDNDRGCYASLRLSRRARRLSLRALTLWAACSTAPSTAGTGRRKQTQERPRPPVEIPALFGDRQHPP